MFLSDWKKWARYFVHFFTIIGLICLSAACSDHGSTAESLKPQIFVPPTLVTDPFANGNQSEIVTSFPEAGKLTSQSVCSNNLKYLSDLSIPDGAQVVAGTVLDKRWQVENSGSCNWNQDYRLRLVAGPALGAASEQALFPARSNTQMVIRIKFVAPDSPSAYRSAWQAFSPQGEPFGDPIFIDIVVIE